MNFRLNPIELGESINNAGREFKYWFTEFTLVYSPIFIVLGLILTGIDLFLNLGLSTSLWFKIPWSIAQLFAVDGLWFAIWNRILTDEYRRSLAVYHTFLILMGLCMTGIAITMNYIVFTQDYLKLSDSLTAMRYIGIPVSVFLLVRSVLLMATATLAIVLDKIMRSKRRSSQKSSAKPVVQQESLVQVQEATPPILALPDPSTRKGYREVIKDVLARYETEGKSYTYQTIVEETGASLQTVKVHAPKIKKELGL